MLKIIQTTANSLSIAPLICELNAYLAELYPSEFNHIDSPEKLDAAGAYTIMAIENNDVIGCGSVKIFPEEYGEIKRVFVSSHARGKGVSKRILQALETHMLKNEIVLAKLETGARQIEAVALYEKSGYRYCRAFGEYEDDGVSVFMEKRLL